MFGAIADRADADAQVPADPEPPAIEGETPARRAARAPWRWERLLADSRVIASADRWERRLNGLVAECTLQQQELQRTEPESPRIDQLARKIEDVRQLEAFALPIIRALAAWPAQATWAEWLDAFAALAPRILRRPDRVLRVFADLRPMGASAR